MQNQFFFSSNMQQEMEFQICSTFPVKSCKIASLSYTSRAIHCALYLPLELYIIIINAKPVVSLFFKCATGNGISNWYYTLCRIIKKYTFFILQICNGKWYTVLIY